MIFKRLKAGEVMEDEAFDEALYPKDLCALSDSYFTSIVIAKKAALFLADRKGTRVLDVGSGVGKFCMIGATITEGFFTGVELRWPLHQLAKRIAQEQQLKNINFIHANINVVDFSLYDAFYFYNPFIENIAPLEKIDDSITLKHDLYKVYTNYVKNQLSLLPVGTKLVIYFSDSRVVPDSYMAHSKYEMEKLTFWIKES